MLCLRVENVGGLLGVHQLPGVVLAVGVGLDDCPILVLDPHFTSGEISESNTGHGRVALVVIIGVEVRLDVLSKYP